MKFAVKSLQHNLFAINMKEVKDTHQEILTKLLQYQMTIQEKNINAQHLSVTTSKYRQNITKHIKLSCNVNKKKTENRNSFCGKTLSGRFDSDRHHIGNFCGTASSNECLMEDQEQEEQITGEKGQKELPMVPVFILDQEETASIDLCMKI